MSEELKPCPFCGSDNVEVIDREIWCECGISLLGGDLQSVQNIIKQWNTRAELKDKE